MNKVIYKSIICVSFITILASSISASTILPLGLKPFDFVYEKIEKSEATNQDNALYTIAPYFLNKNIISYAPLSFLDYNDENKINIFAIANESITAQTFSKPTFYETLYAGISGKLSSNIYFYSTLSLDEEKSKDPLYNGKKWRGLAGGVTQSYFMARFENFHIIAGRFRSFWGIKKSLLLSESIALDGLQYSYNYKKLSLSYRIAKLDQLNNDLTTNTFDNRYFAGHRLDIQLHRKLRVGIFESVIFGGIGRTLEFNYLNPLMSYHAEQLNNKLNDNSFLGFDFTYYPIEKTKLYGQVIVDDYQIENESQGDQEPNQYGFIAGGYIVDLNDSFDMRLEYSKIKNRTYNQMYVRNRYIFENRSIGYFDMNDFDKLSLSVTRWLSPLSNISLHYSYLRKGEGNILDPWTAPWLETNDEYFEKFPFGIVEKTNSFSCQYKSFLQKYFYIDVEFGIEKITNRNNIVSGSYNNKFINISLFSFFSKAI